MNPDIKKQLDSAIQKDNAEALKPVLSSDFMLSVSELQIALESAMKKGAKSVFMSLIAWGVAKKLIVPEYGSDTIQGYEHAVKNGHVDLLADALENTPLQIEQWNDLMDAALRTRHEQTICDVLELYISYGLNSGDANVEELDIKSLRELAEEQKYSNLQAVLLENFEEYFDDGE